MSIQIQPQKNFAIVRQLPDPSDLTTYYVQAVIRNAETDALIATINLTDKGSRRFIGVWPAIADKSGSGTLISIRTSVYTDAIYSTISTTYSQDIDTYLILERFNPNQIVSLLGPALGSDGEKIDYKLIRKIFKETIAESITPILVELEIIEKAQGDDNNIIASVRESLSKATNQIIGEMPKIETAEKIDFSPITDLIESSFSQVSDGLESVERSVKNPEGIDLSPVLDAISKIDTDQKPINESIKKMEGMFEKLSKVIDDKLPGLGSIIDGLNSKLRDMMLSTILFGKNVDPESGTSAKKPDFLKRAKELTNSN